MFRLRSALNSVISGAHYSRFSLQPEEDGRNCTEVELSDEAPDDAVGARGPAAATVICQSCPQRQSGRITCCLGMGALLILIVGYLIGYVSHRKPLQQPMNCTAEQEAGEMPVKDPEPSLYWSDITRLLAQKLTPQTLNQALSELDRADCMAGSAADMHLANNIFNQFKKQRMDPWTDAHYVQLQTQDSERPNRVLFGTEEFQPRGYLAYSATGRVQGKVVYGNYGRQEDLDVLQRKSVELKGSVALLRAGRISFAQQVANAADRGAVAVLIYPDRQFHKYKNNTSLYGHVHLGSGDPYTPGFPSFYQTQFPPSKSCGLPSIPAQTITANMAATILQKIGGPEAEADSGFIGGIASVSYRLGGSFNITVEVNNVLVNREIHNVFGVIRGFTDPDQFLILGAQRDSWGRGYASATMGTAILTELSRVVHELVERDGFKPRRSLVFASWSAGEYGSVGATEWLEGNIASLDRRAFSYISLDQAVMGKGGFVASASPLLHSLIERTLKEVRGPPGPCPLSSLVGSTDWQRPMPMDDPAYPFLAFSGIPSVSFHYISRNVEAYQYRGTSLDVMDHLGYETNQCTSQIGVLAAQFAGHMALRLAHDHLLPLDVNQYGSTLTKAVVQLSGHISQLSQSGELKEVSAKWLHHARGSFMRAANDLSNTIANTDMSDAQACRVLNDRIMMVEHSLLSPYVAPQKTPFRHLLLGCGPHTLPSLAVNTDPEQLRTWLALSTWTLQGSANAMAGEIWNVDNQI